MREGLERLRRDIPLTTLAIGIAAASALVDLARGFGSFVDGLLTHQSATPFSPVFASGTSGGLSWNIGHHILTLDRLVVGAIEVSIVLAAAVFIRRSRPAAASGEPREQH